MPLSRLENFLINTDGNILYVNPSDLDATDSFDNKGNSLTRPFKTLQRALIEAARFSYQVGQDNDRFDRTTILLYPGTHLIDNRRGLQVGLTGGAVRYYDQNNSNVTSSTNLTLNSGTEFDIENAANVLYKFNSVDGGVIVPKGTSIVGLDLRKTKLKPLYVPDPEDVTIDRSAVFRITGGCYFWQFSIFDADREVFFNNAYGFKRNPGYSHHKLTCFEYADGVNKKTVTDSEREYTDLQMYYLKLMNAYGTNTGNRNIVDFPTADDFQPNSPEFKIVGDLTANDFNIVELRADTSGSPKEATVTTDADHNLSTDDAFRITGVGGSALYEGSFKVAGINSTRQFTYTLPGDPNQDNITIQNTEKVIIEADNVTGASPYIFNISLRSTFGMCGMHADGDKATGFKSMVVAQFTGIGLQKDPNAFLIYDKASGEYKNNTTATGVAKPLYINQDAVYSPGWESFHVKASNDSVIQAVSVFAIGFSNHFLAEDGADQSITNSNSNFGAKSLIAKGFRKQSFNRDDTGYITHIVPPQDLQEDITNVNWKVLDSTKTDAVGITSHLYLLGEDDLGNPPSNITDGYKIGCNANELLYLDVVTDTNSGITSTFTAPVLMQVPSGSIDGPQSKKVFKVSRTAGANDIDPTKDLFTLTANHNFSPGESIRIFSDNGRLPDGIDDLGKYFAITTGSDTTATKIKIASTLNNALKEVPVDIFNNKGGFIRIESRVTDKIPGDPGHPIQYDTTNNQWYITSSSITTTNKIFEALDDFTTVIAENNATTYVHRTPENRDLVGRIYKLRYVVPRDFQNAKAPTKNFILQESKTVNEDASINSVKSNRNPRVIANVGRSGSTITITSQQDHNINVGDRVNLKNIVSVGNTLGTNDLSYNGYFRVDTVPTTKTFKVSNTLVGAGDTYTDQIHTIRGGDISNLPVFERNEYKTTFIIQDVETIQEYTDGIQDGIYYLTVLRSDIAPVQDDGSTNPFSGREYKQDFQSIYPVIDRDNVNIDPDQSITAASNSLLGKVSSDDIQNSITKEAVIEYAKDTGVGIAVTGAVFVSGTDAEYFFERNHGLFGLLSATQQTPGSGYGAGVAGTTVYNVALSNGASGMSGADATANITVGTGGSITALTIVEGGSNYRVGSGLTLTVSGGDNNATFLIDKVSNEEEGSIQFVGVGTINNRKTSGYNGVYRFENTSSFPNVIKVLGVGNQGIHTTSNGVALLGGPYITASGIVGVANTTQVGIVTVTTSEQHGLSVGNKVRLELSSGNTESTNAYNKDHIIVGVNTTNFTLKVSPGIPPNNGGSGTKIFKYALGAQGQDTSLQTEKVSGSLLNFSSGFITSIVSNVNNTSNTIVIDVSGSMHEDSVKNGDYLQIEDEIVRVISRSLGGTNLTCTVIRGVMGTTSTEHVADKKVQKINIIPSEVRRFSSIRASGHTFEYVGYGPGNYSTALPQRIQRTLRRDEELLSIYCEKKGGVTFFSGMNDRGEFFTWDGRIKPVERFISEVGNDFTGVFDDLYVRNTLRVGGGPNRNLPSEFRGPVNFTNKITNTDVVDGITAIKLQLQGNAQSNPSFQVGSDASPSLIVNKSSQNVGIKTADPKFELDVNGTIRANVYENFKFSDLPNNTSEESTFAKNRVLKVNATGDGYELVDINTLDIFSLSSYGVSNDGTVYTGTGSNVNNKLRISGISTAKFAVGEKVKVFGANLSSDSSLVTGIPAIPSFSKVGTATTVRRYRYWVAQYHMRTGKVGVGTQINPAAGIGQVEIDNFNDQNHITLTLNRSDTTHGILIYRQESADAGAANINNAKLVGILGPKELTNATSGITYKDFGTYDQTEWSPNDNKNQFDDDQIHFPNIATTGQRRGWAMDEIVSIEAGSITVNGQYNLNNTAGFGTNTNVKVVHDNTYGLTLAVNDILAKGGSYINIPSGVYLAQKLIIPTAFTIKGSGKNTILKQQFFANDVNDGAGNSLAFDNNFVGIGVTNGTDITIDNLTIDGNNSNNIRFESDDDNYMVYFRGISSSLFKNIELRNSPAHGLLIKESNRISIENSSFVDGSITDRYPYEPINAQESTVLRINDSVFENYPGPVDVSVTSVVSTGGNIIRNCGTGLRTYATGKITTSNNIILGPSDEYIPSPDIYDSDFNSINVTIDRAADFVGPIMQYIEDGDPKDISTGKVTIVSAGIGTIVGQGTTNETLGTKFVEFDITTLNTGEFGRQNGYINLSMPLTKTSQIGLTSSLGYNIIAQEYLDLPSGISTYIGISSGQWYKNNALHIGAGATEYRAMLADPDKLDIISVGDVVKLVDHSSSPNLASQVLSVSEKVTINVAKKQLKLTGFTLESVTDGDASGYIVIRKQFVIAKGRVGVI
jgi:hypothetical protein